MMKAPIAIESASFISPLGQTPSEVWANYTSSGSHLSQEMFNQSMHFVGRLPINLKQQLEALKNENAKYKNLDPSVLMALWVAREAYRLAEWSSPDFGINLGSSRGATHLFEHYHKEFLEKQIADTLSSPMTTLGNISSWVASDLQSEGPSLSHSITCSTGLHAVLNGIAWMQAGMSDRFMVGATEAPLTDFTIAQMRALTIYSKAEAQAAFPCRAMDFNKTKNTMVLGEGAGVLCLSRKPALNRRPLGHILGMGYATEPLVHSTSISAQGLCFQKAMRMALEGTDPAEIDAIVMHTPGTVKGDLAEWEAVKQVFPTKLPFLTNNKWKIGHTFAASGILNIEMALAMLEHKAYVQVPFFEQDTPAKAPQKILVNAVGFGANAVSILIGK